MKKSQTMRDTCFSRLRATVRKPAKSRISPINAYESRVEIPTKIALRSTYLNDAGAIAGFKHFAPQSVRSIFPRFPQDYSVGREAVR
jgi:hypothetical protein